jgi:hypothetical protein
MVMATIVKDIEDLIIERGDAPFGKRQWFEKQSIKVYIRINSRCIGDVTLNAIDIASIEVSVRKRGQGIFKKFLQEVEELAVKYNYCVYVESVLNEELHAFLLRNKYVKCQRSYHSVFKLTNKAMIYNEDNVVNLIARLNGKDDADLDECSATVEIITEARNVSAECVAQAVFKAKRMMEDPINARRIQLNKDYLFEFRNNNAEGTLCDLISYCPYER